MTELKYLASVREVMYSQLACPGCRSARPGGRGPGPWSRVDSDVQVWSQDVMKSSNFVIPEESVRVR